MMVNLVEFERIFRRFGEAGLDKFRIELAKTTFW